MTAIYCADTDTKLYMQCRRHENKWRTEKFKFGNDRNTEPGHLVTDTGNSDAAVGDSASSNSDTVAGDSTGSTVAQSNTGSISGKEVTTENKTVPVDNTPSEKTFLGSFLEKIQSIGEKIIYFFTDFFGGFLS